MEFLDDDENVKMMRETARTIGLTDLLMRAFNSQNSGQKRDLLRQALRLLGVPLRPISEK
jgi:hypothetical protein